MATKSFIKTIGEKGLLADYNTSGKKLQTELTAGDNITISADNVISADKQILFATYGVTTYNEVRDAILNGADVIVKKDSIILHSIWFGEEIYFESVVANPTMIRQVILKSDNSWSTVETPLQPWLTFDTAPTAGSNNPVTSDGIKTAIDAKADGDNSVAIFDGYMRRMNESPGWRRLAYKQFNLINTNVNALFRLYLFGGNNEHIGLGDLVVNIRFDSSGSAPELRTCYLIEHKPLNTSVKVRVIGVAGNAAVELWFKPLTFSMLTLTCLGNGLDVSSRTKDWKFGRFLYSTDPEPVEDIANNIYVFSGTVKSVQLGIDNPKSGNLVAMDNKGLVKDSGIKITSSDIANWNSKQTKLTFDTTPTAGSNNPVTSDGIKTAIDAKANVQADWNVTNSSSGAFIKNKPQYKYYSTNSTYAKICSFPLDANGDNVSGYGIDILYRRYLGEVHGRLLYKKNFKFYCEYTGDISYTNQSYSFYYVVNSNKMDVYAKRNGYTTLNVAPLTNIPKDQVDFTDFGTEVSSLPEGATEITPVWVANSERSSGTAPVKVNAFGDLTPVPMDSIPTASSTNLMTSGDIKTALDSRIPAPTSTTGTQVLKCIDGVIQWVTE